MDLVTYIAEVNAAIRAAAMSTVVKFDVASKTWQVAEQKIQAAEQGDGTVIFALFSDGDQAVGEMRGVKHPDAIAEIAPCLAEFLFTGQIHAIQQDPANFPDA